MGRFLTRLTGDMKTAMKARAKARLEVLRMLVAGIKDEQHKKAEDDLSDEDELQVLMRAVKTRTDTVEQATSVGRQDIAEKESAEIEIIEGYLPQQMSEQELSASVREVAEEVDYEGPRDTGKFMKVWMSRYKGQADGRGVQKVLAAL